MCCEIVKRTPKGWNQFPTLTLVETGETFPNTRPDQVAVIGTLADGAVFLAQIEGGKRNGSGLQIDITGTEGDLKISNVASFGNVDDNLVEGARGDGEPLQPLPVPTSYRSLPASSLDASVLDLAYLYDAYARSAETESTRAPDFRDAVRMHKLIDLISEASSSGTVRLAPLNRREGKIAARPRGSASRPARPTAAS
jgi:predicted dehydrogenase